MPININCNFNVFFVHWDGRSAGERCELVRFGVDLRQQPIDHQLEETSESHLGPLRARHVGLTRGPRPLETSVEFLSVVIPAYNEVVILRETIDFLSRGLNQLGVDYEFLICENGSTDGTLELCRELADEYPSVSFLHLPIADYGAALRAGLSAATSESIATVDADYYDMGFISAALASHADIVVGSKQLPTSQDKRPARRRLVSKCFGWVTRNLLGLSLSETHGMKVFKSDAIAQLLPFVESNHDLFDTELLALAERNGFLITEIPVKTEEVRPSRSSIARRIPRTVWGLIKLAVRLRRSEGTSLRLETPLSAGATTLRDAQAS